MRQQYAANSDKCVKDLRRRLVLNGLLCTSGRLVAYLQVRVINTSQKQQQNPPIKPKWRRFLCNVRAVRVLLFAVH